MKTLNLAVNMLYLVYAAFIDCSVSTKRIDHANFNSILNNAYAFSILIQ